MIKKLNIKGEAIAAGVIAVGVVIASITSLGLYNTYQSGVLQKNGQVIWCKVQNKGETFCNDKYGYTPGEGYTDIVSE